MAQILVRGLDESVVARLRKRARREGHSLQSEVRSILEQAARVDAESALRLADRIRSRFKGREFDDSAELIHEDRDR
jgi:plasmid stability protein